ncbi:MAG: replicative DNA helicase [Luteibaculaceae bacterium]
MEKVGNLMKKGVAAKRFPEEFGGGKLPPQALDLEEAVLGALMIDKDAINEAIDILKPEAFYKDAHQKIFAAILELFQKSEPIDILTITNLLRKKAELEFVGGPYYISQLTNRVASAANIQYHARIIAQKHIQRELISSSAEIIKMAYDETTDVFDLLDKAESSLFQIAQGNLKKSYATMSDLIKQAIDDLETKAKDSTDGVSGVPTGLRNLDKITSGWQRSDMIVIAARPAMGKTAFVLSIARNASVDFNRPTAVFSLEMSSLQLVNRLIVAETGIPADRLRQGNLKEHEFQQLHARIGRLADAPLFIDDTPALSIFDLRAKCRRLKSQHNIEMIIIDYLQLMTAGGEGKGNREQEISTISRSIKSIAKELDVPIIALSQLSRTVESRGGDKKPVLSDLRESGAIEQDADMVCFIYRPEYYNFTEDENGLPTENIGYILVAKHRNGSLGDVRLKFIKEQAKFTNEDGFDDAFQGYNPSAGIAPSSDFSNPQGFITMGSRMNDMKDDDDDETGNFGYIPPNDTDEDAPF